MQHPIRLAVASAMALGFALALPQSARAEEIRPVYPVHDQEAGRGPDPLLAATGAALFGVPYATSVVVGATSQNPSDRWLYVPVAGPFATLVARATCTSPGCKGSDLTGAPLALAFDGLMQAAGAYIVYRALATPAGEKTPPAGAVRIVPTTTAHGGGLSAVGTF